jgi:hypothetical protein
LRHRHTPKNAGFLNKNNLLRDIEKGYQIQGKASDDSIMGVIDGYRIPHSGLKLS